MKVDDKLLILLIIFIGLLLVVSIFNLVIGIDNNRKIRQSMADNKQAFQDVLDALNAETNSIASELEDLKGQITGGGMNQEAESEVLAQLDALKARLQGLAADPANPVPSQG